MNTINSYDIETYVNNNNFFSPFCICLYVKKNFKSFYINNNFNNNIIEDSIHFIFNNTKKNEKIIVYIHNINFDGILIISYLTNQKIFVFDTLLRNMNLYYIRITYNSKIIEFRCSYKIIPLSLNTIAKSFKLLNKISFPYKFVEAKNLFYIGTLPNSDQFNSIEDWNGVKKKNYFNFKKYSILYCKRDVRITADFVEIIIKIINSFKINIDHIYSAPSLSYHIFINNFNKSKISQKYIQYVDKLVRPAYYGGRCEVYGNPIYENSVYQFDFSGMYAQCMQQKIPYGAHTIETRFSSNINDSNFYKPGYYSIEFEAYDHVVLPILPHKNPYNSKLMFTNGNISGVYWFEEILILINKNMGCIKKIHYAVLYDKYDYVFNDFVDFFTELRKKNTACNVFGKLIINSLYGRLGMGDNDEITFFYKKDEIDSISNYIKIKQIKELNDFAIITAEKNKFLYSIVKFNNEKNKSNIAIAAAITSKARIKLHNAFEDVIKNNGSLLYSDTDSVFASYKKNIINEQHGELLWKNDPNHGQIKDAVFLAPKSYAIKYNNGTEIIKIKGFNHKNISFDEIKKKFYENKKNIIFDNTYEIKKKNFILYYNIADKTLNINNYDKRKFSYDKIHTSPYIFRNFQYI